MTEKPLIGKQIETHLQQLYRMPLAYWQKERCGQHGEPKRGSDCNLCNHLWMKAYHERQDLVHRVERRFEEVSPKRYKRWLAERQRESAIALAPLHAKLFFQSAKEDLAKRAQAMEGDENKN